VKGLAAMATGLLLASGCGEVVTGTPAPEESTIERARSQCITEHGYRADTHIALIDGGSALDINGYGDESDGATYESIVCVLDGLNAPESVKSGSVTPGPWMGPWMLSGGS
jgi:hypothetical protein